MDGEQVKKNLAHEYQLFWERMSGAIAPQCLLEEMGLAWRKVPIDMATAAHESPDYIAVNPTMRIPALLTPTGKTIGETGAIAWHHGDQRCMPPIHMLRETPLQDFEHDRCRGRSSR